MGATESSARLMSDVVPTLQLVNALLPLVGAGIGLGVAFVLTQRNAKAAVETAKANNRLIAEQAAELAKHDARIDALEKLVTGLRKDIKYIREHMVLKTEGGGARLPKQPK